MRSLVFLCLIAIMPVAVAHAADETESSASTRDVEADYKLLSEQIDQWFRARKAGSPRPITMADERLMAAYERELSDHSRDAELAPPEAVSKKKARKSKGSSKSDQSAMIGDILDVTAAAKDFPRLRAVIVELQEMQPRFDRMEGSAMHYLNKGKLLRELQELVDAEVAGDPEPTPVEEAVVAKESAVEPNAVEAEQPESAPAATAKEDVALKKLPPKKEAPPAKKAAAPKIEILDEEVAEKKEKKPKKEKIKEETRKKLDIEDLDE
ncbi:MAG: hypothetical protein ACI9MC_003059 [Kiritimatiellia bacterium]|jgi:hypothetical protein